MSSDTLLNIYTASSGIIIMNVHGKRKVLSLNAKEKYGGMEV